VRLNVRYDDAHRGFIPVPRVRSRVVLVDDLTPRVKPRGFGQGPEPLPKVPYHADHAHYGNYDTPEYDWSKRKDIATRNMPNVLHWVLPIGYVEPYRPTGHKGDASRELAWLMKTQDMEIPPQWAELAANGIEATSLTDETGGEREDIDENSCRDENYSLALAQTYEQGRRERWTRERDEQTFRTTPARRCRIWVNEEGKRTIQAMYGSRWTREELLAMLKRGPSPINTEPWDEYRETFDIEDQESRVGLSTYDNTDPCPQQQVYYHGMNMWQPVPMCKDGKAPVIESDETGEYVDEWVNCPTCQGTGRVLNMLGFNLTIVDGEEFAI